jgi:hypothetical protein
MLLGFDELTDFFLFRGDRRKLAITFRRNFAQPSDDAACASGDQATDDHIFFQPSEPIDPAGHCGFGQDARRLLE